MLEILELNSTWIVLAFFCGLMARLLGLPPLTGFLVAGFILNFEGIHASPAIDQFADLGVTLLLFTLGLKLSPKDLSKSYVWGNTLIHMAVVIGVGAALMMALGTGLATDLLPRQWSTALVLAFALSFSSTVFAVKVFQDRSETGSLHGRVAIGVLIVQDIVAVIFMSFAGASAPSWWALLLLLLIPARPLLYKTLDWGGHGELLTLFGFAMAFFGAEVFGLVGMKGDFGALLLGVLMAKHAKASDLAKSLLRFKDVMLVGFFLKIGMMGFPDLPGLLMAGIFALVLAPLKTLLFYRLFTWSKMRATTAYYAALALANFSEFGLIVGSVAVGAKWLDQEWLVILAMALSLSFVISSWANAKAHKGFERFEIWLKRWQSQARLPGDGFLDPGDADLVVIGMGRVGTKAYETLRSRYGREVIAVDADPTVVAQHRELGQNVINGDATDRDFWERFRMRQIRAVMLTLPRKAENQNVARHLRRWGFTGIISAAARYEGHVAELESAGVDFAYNYYADAGEAFALAVCGEYFEEKSEDS
ncbi:MAG: cation:proton antiporter [Verrucomicrobiales bacterium]|nr:cation:proton antiporter [Verrucomicrobiales bacterium]